MASEGSVNVGTGAGSGAVTGARTGAVDGTVKADAVFRKKESEKGTVNDVVG